MKDLSKIGRELKDVIIIDNADFSYMFQVSNAFPCKSWYDDQSDRELIDFVPILQALGSVMNFDFLTFNLGQRCQALHPKDSKK